jgi:hypothetical protein
MGERGKPWIGVDLDKTLAQYNGGDYTKFGHLYIGAPIAPMVERVKQWLAEGKDVRILTARVSNPYPGHDGLWSNSDYTNRKRDVEETRVAIRSWCASHLGKELPITCVKDFDMVELWDDRARRVEPNTGREIGE